MSSAPSLHLPKRLSAVEACRLIASEVWRQERRLDDFRTGGLNAEKAVRQRLQSIGMELARTSGLDDKVALHLYSIDWLEADPLTILERTEGLVDRQCRDSYASVDALLNERDRATRLAIRLLVLQGLAGRVGRWAVRAGEIPDARIARAQYRDLGAPEWSQFCRLTDESNAAFDRGEYPLAAMKAFDADRLVRTPASLLMASVALSRIPDFIAALWTARVCLLEPEETFESPTALRKARTLEARLREIVEGRMQQVIEAEPVHDLSGEAEALDPVDIVEEQQDVLETQGAELRGRAAPARKRSDRWGERYLSSDEERAATPQVLVTPKPVVVEKNPHSALAKKNGVTRKDVVTVHEVLEHAPEARITTRPSSPEHVHLRDRERVMRESFFEETLLPRTEIETAESVLCLVAETSSIAFPQEEDTFVPAGPTEDVDMREQTEIPPDPELRRLRERALEKDPKKIAAAVRAISAAAGLHLDDVSPLNHNARTERILRKVVPANQPEELSTDVLATMTLSMGQHTRETALASLDREESAVHCPSEETTSQIDAERVKASQPLKRVYEVTHIVRARHALELESGTEQLPTRRPDRTR